MSYLPARPREDSNAKRTRGRPRAGISVPPVPAVAHTHARAHTLARTHARTHAHKRTGEDHLTPRRQRGGVHACAQIRTAHRGVNAEACTRAHRFERRACAAGHTGGTAEEGRRERRRRRSFDCRSHARAHARMHLRHRPQSADAVAHRYPQRQPVWPNCLFYLAVYVSADLRTNAHACIRMYPSTESITRTHAAVPVCVRAGGSTGRGGPGWTLEHVPVGRTAVRSCPEHRRAAVGWLSRVGTRR